MLRVYVGNLPYQTREDGLRAFFEEAGCKVTEAVVVMDHDGRSKGFGFVSFEDDASFQKALEKNESELGGRPLRINEARPREDRGGESAPAPAPQAEEAAADEAPAEEMNDTDEAMAAEEVAEESTDEAAPASDGASDEE
jgi:RNA recognition motif-containing protein